MSVQIARSRDLLDPPVEHHGDAIGEAEGLLDIVGHEDRGGAGGAEDFPDLGPDMSAEGGVEIRERLVKQDCLRFGGQRAGQGAALLFAARELVRHPFVEPCQAHQPEQLAHPVARTAVEGVGDILAQRHVRKEGVVLEDHSYSPALGRQVHFRSGDLDPTYGDSATVGGLEPGDQAERGGLAAPTGPQQAQ